MLVTPECPGREAKEPGFAGTCVFSSALIFERADSSSGKGSPFVFLAVSQAKEG